MKHQKIEKPPQEVRRPPPPDIYSDQPRPMSFAGILPYAELRAERERVEIFTAAWKMAHENPDMTIEQALDRWNG